MPKVSKSKMGAFLAEIKQDGVKTVYADPKNIAGSKMDALWTTKEAKYVIIKNNAPKTKSKFDLLPIIIPSPRCSIEAVSTQNAHHLRLLLSQLLWLLHIKAFCAHV